MSRNSKPPSRLLIGGRDGHLSLADIAGDTGLPRVMWRQPIGTSPLFSLIRRDNRIMTFANVDHTEAVATVEVDNKGANVIKKTPLVGKGACFMSATAEHALVSFYESAHLQVLNHDQALVGDSVSDLLSESTADEKPSSHSRQDAPHPHQILPLRSDRGGIMCIAVCDLGRDTITTYGFKDGQLFLNSVTRLPENTGPRHMAYSPKHRKAYVVGELDNTLHVFDLEGDMSLKPCPGTEKLSTLPPGYNQKPPFEFYTAPGHVAGVLVTSDDKFVVACNRGPDNLAIFRLDEAGVPVAISRHGSGNVDSATGTPAVFVDLVHRIPWHVEQLQADSDTGTYSFAVACEYSGDLSPGSGGIDIVQFNPSTSQGMVTLSLDSPAAVCVVPAH